MKCSQCKNEAVAGKARCLSCLTKHKESNKLRSQQRIAAGLCPSCGKPASENKRHCVECLKWRSQHSKKARLKRHITSCCKRCGKKVDIPGSRCKTCATHLNKWGKEDRAKRRASGICYDCSNKSLPNKRLCQICADKHLATVTERKQKLLAAGLCILCGKLPHSPNIKRCPKCSKHVLKRQRIRLNKLKKAAFEHYGGPICACCGEDIEILLTIDHINNDGNLHRLLSKKACKIYSWLKLNNYPSGFQVLCFSCNIGKHLNGGVCPHKQNETRINNQNFARPNN